MNPGRRNITTDHKVCVHNLAPAEFYTLFFPPILYLCIFHLWTTMLWKDCIWSQFISRCYVAYMTPFRNLFSLSYVLRYFNSLKPGGPYMPYSEPGHHWLSYWLLACSVPSRCQTNHYKCHWVSISISIIIMYPCPNVDSVSGRCTIRRCLSSVMMTSSDRNIFRITGLLCGDFTGHRWIPPPPPPPPETPVSLICSWINGWVIWDAISPIMKSP